MARESKRTREARRFGASSLLADRLDTAGWIAPYWYKGDPDKEEADILRLGKWWLEQLASSMIVEASHVTKYMFADNHQEDWKYQDDFPCCVLKSKSMFIETLRPPFSNSGGRFTPTEEWPQRWAWLLNSLSRQEHIELIRTGKPKQENLDLWGRTIGYLSAQVDRSAAERRAARLASGDRTATAGLSWEEKELAILLFKHEELMRKSPDELAADVPDNLLQSIQGHLLFEISDRVSPIASCSFEVDTNGRMIEENPRFQLLGTAGCDAKTVAEAHDMARATLYPILLSLSFLNCKNVNLMEVQPDVGVNRLRRKNQMKPFYRHHVLKVDPTPSEKKPGRKGAEPSGEKRPLHRCSGSFAFYTADKPLFGRITGLIWRPEHVRGTYREGVVSKTYEVHPPRPSIDL